MEKASVRVSVVIPALNVGHFLHSTLSSLRDQDFPRERMEVVVVDNSSTDDTVRVAQAFDVRIVTASPRNRAVARNAGIRATGGDIIFFLDADCRPSPNWLSELTERILSSGAVAAQGLITPEGASDVDYDHFALEHLGIPFIDTKGCAITRQWLDAHGHFDESLRRCEDIDLGWRIVHSGERISYDNCCRVVSGIPTGIGATILRAWETSAGLHQVHARWKRVFNLGFLTILRGFAAIGRRELRRRGARSGLPRRVIGLYTLDSLLTGFFYLARLPFVGETSALRE